MKDIVIIANFCGDLQGAKNNRFVYLAELEYNWHEYFATGWGIAAIFGIALAMTVLFSLKPFTIPFDALQKIKVNRLLRN